MQAEHGVLDAQGLTIDSLTGSTFGYYHALMSACQLPASQSLDEPCRNFKSLGQQVRPFLEELEDDPAVYDCREVKLEFLTRDLKRTTDCGVGVVGAEWVESSHCV